MKILRTPTQAKGGITPEEKLKLDAHAQLWIKRIMRTDPINPTKIIPAIEKLYEVSGLKKPRVIIVPSPLVGRLANGIAASVWYLRKKGSAATDAATYAATYEATDAATYAATREATDAATYAATREATDAATRDATREATYAATDAATREATYAATREATDAATRDATREATYAATREATREATYAATRDATREATYEATDAATREATYAATREATDAATRDASWLMSLVKKFTPNSIKLTLGCISASWNLYQGGNMWGQWDCYLTAMRDVIGLKLPIFDKYSAWEECTIEGGFRYMHEEFCMVSDFPEFIHVDSENRPHCTTGPYIKWRDGFCIYMIHGVKFTEEQFERAKMATIAEILSWEDIDQRSVLLRERPQINV